jgi:hypothetical protein
MNAKNLIKAAALATLVAASLGSAQAAVVINQPFNVTVNLTSSCTMTAPTPVAFTYTSFQPTAATSTGGAFSVSCTNTLPYTVAITGASTSVIGLTYALALSAASGTGNGSAQSFTINGTMASGQAGTCATATCLGTDSTHTVTVTY